MLVPEFSSSWVWCGVNVRIDPLFLQLLASVRIILKLDNFDICYSSIVRNLPILLICRYASYMCGNLNAILSFRYLLTEQYVLQLPVQVYHNWWYRFSPTSHCFKCISQPINQLNEHLQWINCSSVLSIRGGQVLLAATVYRQALPASKLYLINDQQSGLSSRISYLHSWLAP